MTFYLQDPVDVRRDLRGDLLQRIGHAGDLGTAGRAEVGGSDGEQHLGGEDEAVANDTDFRVVSKHFPQAAKELGTVAGEFLHLAGERRIQPLAKRGNLHLLHGRPLFRRLQRRRQLRDLLAQRRRLLIQQRELGAGAFRDLALLDQPRFRLPAAFRQASRLALELRPECLQRGDVVAKRDKIPLLRSGPAFRLLGAGGQRLKFPLELLASGE